MNDEIAKKLKAAAAMPGDARARAVAIDAAIAWCKRTYPNHFTGDDYAPPKTQGRRGRRPSSGKADGPGN